MTEKRYEMKCHEINSWYIEKDGKVLIFDLFKSDAEILYTELNNLSDKNEQLKYNLSAYMVDLNNCKGKCSALEIENEQLKKEIKSLREDLCFREMELEELEDIDKNVVMWNDKKEIL